MKAIKHIPVELLAAAQCWGDLGTAWAKRSRWSSRHVWRRSWRRTGRRSSGRRTSGRRWSCRRPGYLLASPPRTFGRRQSSERREKEDKLLEIQFFSSKCNKLDVILWFFVKRQHFKGRVFWKGKKRGQLNKNSVFVCQNATSFCVVFRQKAAFSITWRQSSGTR